MKFLISLLLLSSLTSLKSQSLQDLIYEADAIKDAQIKVRTIRWNDEINGVSKFRKNNCKESTRATRSDKLTIKHNGYRTDTNQQIDSSGPNGMLIERLGHGSILNGMERGIAGMCVGEIIEVQIPPHMGYYEPGKNYPKIPVPPELWVRYEIELLKIWPRFSYTRAFKALFKPKFLAVVLTFGFIVYNLITYMKDTRQPKGGNGKRSLKRTSSEHHATGPPSLRVGTERRGKGKHYKNK